MKRSLSVLLLTIASTGVAGITYKAQSNTTGIREISIAGSVAVDGSRMRMDVTKGDEMIFKDNSVVLSTDGGKTMEVFDPSAKTFYQLQLEQILGDSNNVLQGLGDMVKVTFDNAKANVTDGGAGGSIENLPTHKYEVTASYDMNIDVMGQKVTSHLTMNTETWNTDQLAPEMSSFLQMRGLRTGIPAVDKLIEQSSTMRGFPLKSISTIHVSQGGQDLTMTTTATVTDIQKKDVDASLFATPAGYTKVDDPVTKMMKSLKQ
jgi:hypothetical protein